jgi:hypothetical protein
LPGSEFDDALNEARDYHEKHPPLEFIGRPVSPPALQKNVERLERKKDLIEKVNEGTVAELIDEHREKLMVPFKNKSVPPKIAGEIVDKLILSS